MSEGFLSRWSRRKRGQEAAEPAEPPQPVPTRVADAAPSSAIEGSVGPDGPVGPAGSGDARPEGPTVGTRVDQDAEARPGQAGGAAGSLPEVASLTPDSDFRPFMRSGVEPSTRNAALRKLFSDPHFNEMDGLDTYIEDYGKFTPIPPEILKQLVQSELLGLFRKPEEEARPGQAAEPGAEPVGEQAADPAAGPPAESATETGDKAAEDPADTGLAADPAAEPTDAPGADRPNVVGGSERMPIAPGTGSATQKEIT